MMTDPKELADIATRIRKRLNAPEIYPHALPLGTDEAEIVATALDTLARILAASPDVREIEDRHADDTEAHQIDQPRQLIAILHADRAHLLDVVRKLTGERDKALEQVRGWERVSDKLATEAAKAACEEVKADFFRRDVRERLLTAELAAARTALDEERARHAETRALVKMHEQTISDCMQGRLKFAGKEDLETALAAAAERAETMAEGVRLAMRVVDGDGYIRSGLEAWWTEHGAEVGERKP